MHLDAFTAELMQLMPLAFMQCVTDIPLLIERLLLDLSSIHVFDTMSHGAI